MEHLWLEGQGARNSGIYAVIQNINDGIVGLQKEWQWNEQSTHQLHPSVEQR